MFKKKLLCSIAFNYHDSSVTFAFYNKIVLVIEAERFFREKKKCCSVKEMEELVIFGLNQLNKTIDDVDFWVMTTFNNPFIDQNEIIDDIKSIIRDPFVKEIVFFGVRKKVLFVNHHLAHAGVYFSTNLKDSLIISCDGGGDVDPNTNTNECLAIFKASNNLIAKLPNEYSNMITGKTYGVCSAFIYGTSVITKNPSEGKLMALAALGSSRQKYYNFLSSVFEKIETSDYSCVSNILERSEFGYLKGQAGSLTKDGVDFASTVHKFFIDKRMENIEYILKKYGKEIYGIVLTGGTALNLDLNTKIYEKYKNLKHFIAPCCDDTGQSLGAMCILISKVFKKRTEVDFPYLGLGNKKYSFDSSTISQCVDILQKNGILLVHNGKAEIGPRALGNRSFIARPDSLKVKKMLSEEIKKREPYRPIAPITIEEMLPQYFIGPTTSPFMLYRHQVKPEYKEKLVGALHANNSARVQTVSKTQNKFIFNLIKSFGEKTGLYFLLNTSLNLQGEPLSSTYEDSFKIYNKINCKKGFIYNGQLVFKN